MPLGVEERSKKGKLGNIKWPDETERGKEEDMVGVICWTRL